MFYDFLTKYADFLLKKCEKLLHCKSYSHFFNTKNIGIFETVMFEIFNVSLPNDVGSFERLDPDSFLKSVIMMTTQYVK